MNSDRYVIWRGRQVAKASALGAAIVRCDFESVFRMERQQELLDAIARAKTDRVHCQLVFAAAARSRGNFYWVMPLERQRGNV